MIKTKYNPISEELCDNYFEVLVNRIYKVLPLKEEGSETLSVYIESLLSEMTGNKELIDYIRNDGQYLSVMNSLEFIRQCDDIIICKREVFKCIRTVKNLQRKYF